MPRRRKKIYYCRKDLTNPFFQRRKKKKIYFSFEPLLKNNKLIVFGIIFLAIGSIWLVCFSSIFIIKQITINGLTRINSEEIENLIWQQTKTKKFLFFPQKNLPVFSKKELAEKLIRDYSFENLSIKKRSPRTLVLDIQEKSYAFIWSEGDRYYYSDIDGYLINEVNSLEIKQNKYPIISNLAASKIFSAGGQSGLGKIDIDSNYISYVMNLFNEFTAKEGEPFRENLVIEKFIIDNEINTVKLVLAEGPLILFNTSGDQEKQIKKMFAIKNESLKDDFKNKVYIDLRYGDTIYYH